MADAGELPGADGPLYFDPAMAMADAGELPGADGPLYFAPVMADERERPAAGPTDGPAFQLTVDCIEEIFNVVNPSLGDRAKAKDITVRKNHLTPTTILRGGERWTEFYWNNIDLCVPGEKTLVDPRDPVWAGMTRKWCTAASNASWFIGSFFNPQPTLPKFAETTSTEFQEWLSDWREAGHQPALGPGEIAGHVVPTAAETEAYDNQENLQHVNLQHRIYTDPNVFVHFEILIMWDFNAAAQPGQVTWPRVSVANIRFHLDLYDTLYGLGHSDRLKCHLVFKDTRGGRYTQTPRSKREYHNNTILGRQWQAILQRALAEYERYLHSNSILGQGAEDTEVAQDRIAKAAWRRLRATWGPGRELNRGQVKFWMCDAFKMPRRYREDDPDIGAWLRRTAH